MGCADFALRNLESSLLSTSRLEGSMSMRAVQRKTQKQFLDIPSAALQAGYSPRHFRRIIEEDRIPVMQIGRKFFIVTRDLEAWKSTRGEARFDQAIQQVDGWIKQKVDSSAHMRPTEMEEEE
jgi:hypothetical protein